MFPEEKYPCVLPRSQATVYCIVWKQKKTQLSWNYSSEQWASLCCHATCCESIRCSFRLNESQFLLGSSPCPSYYLTPVTPDLFLMCCLLGVPRWRDGIVVLHYVLWARSENHYYNTETNQTFQSHRYFFIDRPGFAKIETSIM